jgi:hypothetical protein
MKPRRLFALVFVGISEFYDREVPCDCCPVFDFVNAYKHTYTGLLREGEEAAREDVHWPLTLGAFTPPTRVHRSKHSLTLFTQPPQHSSQPIPYFDIRTKQLHET